jgi:hypothetical protein
VLQTKLGNRLPRLLLIAVVDCDGCASGDVGLAALACRIRVGVVGGVVVLDLRRVLLLLGGYRLVGKFFDTWIGHGCSGVRECWEGGLSLMFVVAVLMRGCSSTTEPQVRFMRNVNVHLAVNAGPSE